MIALPRVPRALPLVILGLLAVVPTASALLAVEATVGLGEDGTPPLLDTRVAVDDLLAPEIDVAVAGAPVLGSTGARREAAATAASAPAPTEAAPVMAPTAAAVSLGLSALLPALAAPGLPLYSRIERGDVLRNDVRRRIYDRIVAQPGVKATALMRDLDVGWGTVHHHLQRLRETGYVTATEGRTGIHLFAAGLATPEERAAALAPTGTASRIAAFIRENPGVSQTAVAEALGLGAPAVSKHLARLVREGLVTARREWRTVRYHDPAAPAPPAPA